MVSKSQTKLLLLFNKVLLFIVFFLIGLVSKANVSFYNINDLFGISIRETASTCMDDYGFIWVSSKTGIIRLTEDDYRIYQLPYESPNVFTVKLVFKNSNLFAYTNNGQIFQYNRVLDRFDFKVNFGIIFNTKFLSVNNLLIDSDNRFWVSSSIGLIKYENGKAAIIFSQIGDLFFIEWYNNNKLFLAGEKELVLYDTRTGKIERKLFDFPDKRPRVSKLYYESPGEKLWIGTVSAGLYVYNLNSDSLLYVKDVPKQPILAMDFINDSIMLVGVDGQGLWEVNRSEYSIRNVYKDNSDNPNSIRGNGVYDVFCDQTGKVWVCTYGGGVSYFNQLPTFLTHLDHVTNDTNSLVNNDVNDVFEDSRGNMWFATNNGISHWDIQSNKWDSFYHNKQEQAQVFLSLCEDASGNIWAGTYASGVYLIDGKSGKEIKHYPQDGDTSFTSNFVFDIIKDKEDNIWIVGVKGDVVCYEQKSKRFINYGENPVSVIKELSSDKMLFGCSYGISVLNKATGVVEILLSGFLVQDLVVLKNQIWFGTIGDGLVRFNMDTKSVEKFDVEFGLPSNFVNSIIYDNGYFWLGTENGICKFNPNDKSVETFPSIRSLSEVSFNRGAHFKKKNGEIIWGTTRGVMMFNPSAISKSQPQGKIYVQDIRVLGRSLREGVAGEISLPLDSLESLYLRHNQNTLSMEMLPMGMSYGARFSWFLEGFDTEWSRPINNRSLNYTNLPTGEFRLKLRMYDNSLSEIIDERSLLIIKKPPFWETWWFLLIVTLVLLATFYLSLKYYINLIKQLHSEEKIRFFANTAHDMRTSLTLIKAPIEELNHEPNMTDQGKYYLNLVKEQADRLAKVVTQLMDFQKADIGKEQLALTKKDLVSLIEHRIIMFKSFSTSNKVELKFSTTTEKCFSVVDESMIEKVVDNLISNGIKYSKPDGVVEVIFSLSDHQWNLEVKDYGIGISKEAKRQLFKEFYRGENAVNSKIVGSGIGLLMAKKYISLHEGTIMFSSQLNVGTSFKVSVPVKENETSLNIPEEEIPSSELVEALSQEDNQEKAFTVLIVEDNDDLRNFLQQTLRCDFNIVLASDGDDAWELIKENLPDLIVSDVMMPNRDGFELCSLVKSTYESSHIPVILLTALSDKSEQLRGLGLGADDYLTKPFDTTLLRQRIKSIISNRIAIREKALKLIVGNVSGPILNNQLNDQFVKKALGIVRDNISNPEFNKDMFASEMNVSVSLLYKKIKSLTDQSPSDFIKTIRLTNSLELLKARKYSITEVSELSGFSSVGYFSTVFKKHFGKSPSEAWEDNGVLYNRGNPESV